MAVQQLTLPGALVKKSNDLVRSKISINNVQAARLLATLISSIHSNDETLDNTYTLPIKNLLSNDSGKSYAEIKTAIRELSRAFFEEEFDNVVEDDIILVETPFFSRITYKKGVIYALFNPLLSYKLLNLKSLFTQYNLIEYINLPSIYSQRIFEILKSWSNSEHDVTLTVESLHTTLGTPNSFRANFKEFRRWVLEKAHKDITKNTTLSYEWEPIKQGRAIIAVRFIFSRKLALPVTRQRIADAKEKQSQNNNTAFLAATTCIKERGLACEGGHQKSAICELCRNIR